MFSRIPSKVLRATRLNNTLIKRCAPATIRSAANFSSNSTELKNEVNNEELIQIQPVEEVTDSVPWYLREEESSKLDKPIFRADMPEIPITCPESTQPIISYMINKLGLDDFKVFDIRNLEGSEEIPISSLGDIMILATGKSDRHLQNASQDLLTYIKTEFDRFPYVEGLMKPNSMVRMRRRLKKRMMNKKNVDDDLFGVGVNSWVMIDTKVNNIFIHLMTEERRSLLNLEYLWCLPEEKELYSPKNYSNVEINGREVFDDLDNSDSIFKGLRRFYSVDNRLELDEIVLKNVANNEFYIPEEQLQSIKTDSNVSLNIINGVLQNLETSPKESINEEILANLNSTILQVFPFEPTLDHWNSLFEFYYFANFLDGSAYPFDKLTETLQAQASSGISITKDQLHKFIRYLNVSNSKPQPITDSGILNQLSHSKYYQLFKILNIIEINNPDLFNDENVVLDVLRIPTQQHIFEKIPADYSLLYSYDFNTLVDFFYGDGLRKPSPSSIEFILVTYLKSNKINEFWSFWEFLNKQTYVAEEQKLIVDERPWDLLLSVLDGNYNESFVQVLINEKASAFVDLNLKKSDEIDNKFVSILNKFDDSRDAYPELRAFFQSA